MQRTNERNDERKKKQESPAKKKKKMLEKISHKNIADGTDDKVEQDALTLDMKKADRAKRPMTADEVKTGLAKRREQFNKHVREMHLPWMFNPVDKTGS